MRPDIVKNLFWGHLVTIERQIMIVSVELDVLWICNYAQNEVKRSRSRSRPDQVWLRKADGYASTASYHIQEFLLFIIIMIIQYLYSTLKSHERYRGVG